MVTTTNVLVGVMSLVQIVMLISLIWHQLPMPHETWWFKSMGALSATFVTTAVLQHVYHRLVGQLPTAKVQAFIFLTILAIYMIIYLLRWPFVAVSDAVVNVVTDLDDSGNVAALTQIDGTAACSISKCLRLETQNPLEAVDLTRDNCEQHATIVRRLQNASELTAEQSACLRFAERDKSLQCRLCKTQCVPSDQCDEPDIDTQLDQSRDKSRTAMQEYDPTSSHTSFHRTWEETFM